MTHEERQRVLAGRMKNRLPWHAPPHFEYVGNITFLVSAACYEHASIIGVTSSRMADFEIQLLQTCREFETQLFAWCVLPNHYHLLIRTDQIATFRKTLGLLHGRTSYLWNKEENRQGRQVWYRCFERPMQSDGHFWASVNYIHHNPVRHGYVNRWQDWPYSSATQFLERIGREKAIELWNKYPLLDYGDKWDE